jgi:hypothetical protein
MIALQILLVVFCHLLLAAHFMRAGAFLMMILSFGLLAFFAVGQRWAARILQTWLAVGVVVWLLTLMSTASDRLSRDKPWVRMAVILGAVAAVNALAILTIQRGRLGRYFGFGA